MNTLLLLKIKNKNKNLPSLTLEEKTQIKSTEIEVGSKALQPKAQIATFLLF